MRSRPTPAPPAPSFPWLIVGVVVVVSLVVVGLVVTQTDSAGDVSSTSSQIGSLTGELGISEAVLN
ncbi:MAG: hypothetical protein ACK45X_05005, partial [Roseiflexaceae bacterium]